MIEVVRDKRGQSMAVNPLSDDKAPTGPSGLGVLGLTAQIVSAHVANNKVSADELPSLIQQVYLALSGPGTGSATLPNRGSAAVERPKPAVAISKSVFNEYIVCLEDGKKLKMLKRH